MDAGTAKVSTIAAHWRVSVPTARRILEQAGLVPAGEGPKKYRWQDIWRLEGETFVPQTQWSEYKAPLLSVPELPALDEEHWRKARTWRRHVEKNRIPVISLGKGIKRIRRSVFLVARHYV